MASMSQISIVGKARPFTTHLPGHDEQQYNADDQKQNAADQINRVLDVLLLELRAPVIQSCFDAFYQIFHLFPLLFKYKSRGTG